jgi:hypothetical protein
MVAFEKILRINDVEVPDPMDVSGFGVGLDVDWDPTTCAPHAPGACALANGVDNAMGELSITINQFLQPEVQNNYVTGLFDFKDLRTDGVPFDVYMYYGERDPLDPTCNPLTDLCNYNPHRENFDEFCNPRFFLDNAVGQDMGGYVRVVAGGPGNRLGMEVKLLGVPTMVYVHNFGLDVDLILVGSDVVAGSGVAGFAVRHADVVDGVNSLSASDMPDLNGDTFRNEADRQYLLNSLLPALMWDIDTDGDSVPDAISVSAEITMGQAAANSSVACGDGWCALSENACNCPADCADLTGWTCAANRWADGVCDCLCGKVDSCDCAVGECGIPSGCGNGWCEPGLGEDCGTCPVDCGCGMGETCFRGSCCTPDCTGIECGHDGCGGLCGWCTGTYEACVDEQCVLALGDCASLLRCVQGCGGASACVESCYNAAPTHAQNLYVSMMVCVMGRCGLTPTPECTIWALDGPCKTRYDACVTNTY